MLSPKRDERKKLNPVARCCVLVGYGSEVQGYWLYDPKRPRRITYSRDVKFNEMEFGLKKESHSLDSSPRYVELEISTTESPPQSDNLEVSQADTEA